MSAATVYRAAAPGSLPRGFVLRGGEQGDGRTLSGHFGVVNVWTEIDSYWEGHFKERIAPGAFTRSFARDRAQLRVLFQHGHDMFVHAKPIAVIRELREDGIGAYHESELLDGVPQLIVSGLRAGQYGASFRFRVLREELEEEPGESEHNPKGLPERTILDLELREFGPVVWGAYPEATSALGAAA